MMAKLSSIELWLAADPQIGGLPEEPSFKTTSPGELLGNLVWVMVALGIVIVLIVLLSKWLSKRSKIWGVNRALRSLGGTPLGQNSSLQVVELSGRIYVVGVGQNVTLLDKIDDPLQVEELLAAFDREASQSFNMGKFNLSSIAKWKEARQGNTRKEQNETTIQDNNFEDLLQNQLNQRTMRNEQLKQLIKDAKSNERLMDNEK